MFLQTDGLSLPSLLRPLSVLVLHLILIHSCRGQSQMIGPPHPIVARVGDDIILPCHLEPAADVSAEILEWKRHDLKPEFVFVLRSGQDLQNVKNPSYRGRTSVFMNELKYGNVSLKLSKVQLSDQGTYECDLPVLHKQSSVKFMIASDTASSPEITLLGVDKKRRVILHCESKGWYADTEVLWLDGEGNLLSAGPPETVRGPDDLYTVSSRVTVEKRHSNNFTCRVQQKNINQTREAHIHVPDDFFKVQSRSSYIIIGLAVSLAVSILLILFFFVKWRQNKKKTKRSHMDETDTGEKRKNYESEEEREREQLTTDETVQMKVLKAKGKKKSKHAELKRAELQQLHEEKQKIESDLQNLKEELERIQSAPFKSSSSLFNWTKISRRKFQEERQRRKETENKVQTLEEELQKKISKVENNKQSAGREWLKTDEELKRKTEELDQTKRHVDILRAELTEEKEKSKNLQMELDTMKREHDGSSSAKRPVIEVDQGATGKYIRLRSTSCQDEGLGGWKLKSQINNKGPISLTFDPSFILEAGQTVTMWVPGYGTNNPPTDLVWRGLKSWSTKDHLQIDLFSSDQGTYKCESKKKGK